MGRKNEKEALEVIAIMASFLLLFFYITGFDEELRQQPPPDIALFLEELPTEEDCMQTTVYITNTGERYHLSGCVSLRKSRIPLTLEEAIDDGYTSCGNCKPWQKICGH